MAKLCSTVDSLNKEVMRRVNIALNGEVSEIVKKKLTEHIQSDVMRSYTPVEYERRGSDGLDDEMSIVATVSENTLRVRDEASPDAPRIPGYSTYGGRTGLSKLIEEGAHNPWNSVPYAWTKPRPFVTKSQEDINENPESILRAIGKQF